MEKRTQTSEIIRHMREHGSITQKEATDNFGNRRLSSIICGLRDRGYEIETVMHEGKNRFGSHMVYAEYILKRDPEETLDVRVLNYMKEHGSINDNEGIFEFGCYRLASVMYRLRRKGYKIVATTKEKGRWLGCTKYVLKGEPND